MLGIFTFTYYVCLEGTKQYLRRSYTEIFQKILVLLELFLRNRWGLKCIVPHKENKADSDTDSKRGSLGSWIGELPLLGEEKNEEVY